MIDAEGALTVRPSNGAESGVANIEKWPPWLSESSSITSASFANRIFIDNPANLFLDCDKLETINLHGLDISQARSIAGMFQGCASLKSIDLSELDTSNVQDMRGLVSGCSSLTSVNISSLDTSNVQNAAGLFGDCASLKSVDVEGLNLTSLINGSRMFYGCSSLESVNLSGLDLQCVQDASELFGYCTSITSIDFGRTNFSSLQDTSKMFRRCSSLNSIDFSETITTNTLKKMDDMFSGCSSLTVINMSRLNTSNVYTMSNLFENCSSLKFLDLSGLDTSNVLSTSGMFSGCSQLASLSFSGADTSKVYDMHRMFKDCSSLKSLDLSNLDASNVNDASEMFEGCLTLDCLDLPKLKTSKLTNIESIFTRCESLQSLELTEVDTSNIRNMRCAFEGCSSLQSFDAAGLNLQSMTDATAMLRDCKALRSVKMANLDLSHVTSVALMFSGCTSLESVDFSNTNASQLKNFADTFESCTSLKSVDFSEMNLSSLTSLQMLFYRCQSLQYVSFSGINAPNVKQMSYAFDGCSALQSIDLSGFCACSIQNMQNAFSYCRSLQSLNLSCLNTSNVKSMKSMLSECSSLQSINLTGLNTSKVEDMENMFRGCKSLQSIDFSGLDTSSVKGMAHMFQDCRNLSRLTLTDMQTKNVDNMAGLFLCCDALSELDLSSFDTHNVNDMSRMFDYCASLELVTVGEQFSFSGNGATSCTLPTPTVDGAKGMWVDTNTGTAYSPSDVPDGKEATYVALWDTNPITPDMFSVDLTDATYSGQAIERAITSSNLTKGKDFDVVFSDNIEAGTATIIIKGKRTYSGSLRYNFKIAKAIPTYQVPDRVIAHLGQTLADVQLTEGFTWQESLTTNVGEFGQHTFHATYTPDDTANYEIVRDIPITVNVEPIQIDGSMFAIDTSDAVYTGSAIERPVTSLLAKDVDYSVSYRDNTKAGLATVTVTGKGRYAGTLTYGFVIRKADPAYEAPSQIEASYGQALGELALPEGFSWQDDPSTPVGEPGERTFLATFTPDDAANYNAVRDVPVAVRVTRQVDASMFSLSQDSYAYDGSAHEPAVSSDAVPAGSYSVEYRGNVDAGQATAVVTGGGFYAGSCELHFAIAKADPAYEAPSQLVGSYGEALGGIALPEGFSWQDGAGAEIDWYGVKTLRLVFTPADAANYNTVRGIPVEVYVQRGSVEVPAVAPLTYTGGPQKPLLDGDPRITVLANDGGTDAGSYTATVALADPAFDRWADGTVAPKAVEWCILPADLSAVDFDGPADAVLENGKAEPAVTATFNGRGLVQGRDFAVSYEGNASYGDARATATGLGNFTGERSFGFRIGKADISAFQPMIYDKVVAYKGEPAQPRVYLLGDKNGMTLHEGIDYEVEYADNGAVGTARAVLRGIGDYVGSVEATFDVVDKIDVSSSAVTLHTDPCAFYTGEPIAQPVSYAKLNGWRDLAEGVDYEVSYEDNVKPGQAAAVVRGIGDFTGETRLQFSIVRKGDYDLSTAGSITLTGDPFAYGGNAFLYRGGPVEPNVSVRLKVGSTSMRLVEGVDYSVSYSGNSSVGSAYATVTGINGLEGMLSKPFQIAKTLPVSSLGLSSASSLDQIDYDLKDGSPAKPKLLPYPGFVEGADYELSYRNCDKIGTGTVTVTGRGRYTGSVDLPARIVDSRSRLLLYDCTVDAIPDQVYTGDPIEPSVTVRDANGRALDPGLEYGASYSGNVNAGEASVLVANGAGFASYDGYLQTSFNILPADIAGCKVSGVEDQRYTGRPATISPTVTFNGKRLEEGTDYRIGYEGNNGVGAAKATIVGVGNYSGSVDVPFEIKPAELPDGTALDAKQFSEQSWQRGGNSSTFRFALSEKSFVNLGTASDYIDSATCTLRDSAGKVISRWDLKPGEVELFGLFSLPAGTFYVTIEGSASRYDAKVGALYEVSDLEVPAGSKVELEPNDPAIEASLADVALPVGIGEQFVGTSFDPEFETDRDFYRFDLDRATTLSFLYTTGQATTISLLDEAGDPVRDPDTGEAIAATTGDKPVTSNLRFGTLPAGTYYLCMEGPGKAANANPYRGRLHQQLEDAQLTLDCDSFEYDGAAKEPRPAVTLDGRTLREGVDYNVTYYKNTAPGKALVYIASASSSFTGGKGAYFDIVRSPGNEFALPGSWARDSSGWWWRNDDGTHPANCWQIIDGKRYRFGGSGYMQTGWAKVGGSWYWLGSDGAMRAGWQKVGGTWYWFADGGAMATGWKQIGGTWYLFNGSGAMLTGWQKVGGAWYWFAGSGAMATGWQQIGGAWYWFDASGAMATGWFKVGGTYYYANGSGAMQSNRWVGSYYLTGSGAMATNAWIGPYHVGADGRWDNR